MPFELNTGGPAPAADGVSIQTVSGTQSQKSEILSGAVTGANFTTSSATFVDVTGMTVTLAGTNNVASQITVRIGFTVTSAGDRVAFSLVSTATKEYVWTYEQGSGNAGALFRNADANPIAGSAFLQILLLDGFVSGTTSAKVVKVQAEVVDVTTLTVKIGSVIYAQF